MTQTQKPGFAMTERLWQLIILILAAGVLFITFWCLTNGITTIFMHLYYFPIVLLAYHYRWKGFSLATGLALAYLGLVVLFGPGRPDEIMGALYRFIVFVGIAAIIAYLSEQLTRAERAGQESTQIKEQYISLAPAIILVLDRNGAITYLNEKGCEILECPAGGIAGKDWVNTFIKEDERESVRSLFVRVMDRDPGPDRMVEGEVVTGKGTIRTIRWYNTLLKTGDGIITGVLSYGEDITDEKAAQDSLKTLQQFQESVIANANVWISVLAPDGTIVVWNDAAEQISGYKKADVVGKNAVWKQLYPDSDYRRWVTREIRRVLSSDTTLEDFETEIQCADTTHRTIVWNTRAMQGQDGNATRYIAIGRDVTGQRAAELRAGESSRFLGAMIDTLPVPVFFKDTSGNYLGCNPPFSEYLGISREEIVGKSVYDLSPKDLADTYAAADQKLFGNPVPQRYETQVQYADGSLHDVIFYKAPFFHTDGTLGGLIGTFLDITDRKRSEEKILLLLNSAAEAIYGIDMDGNCTFCNRACLTSLGYQDEEDLIGKNMHWQIHGKHADGSRFPKEECRIYRAFRTGEATHVDDEVFWRADGSSFPAEYWSYPQRDKGVVVGAVVTFLDITERQKAENALKESEAKYRTLFENMLEGFAYCRMIYDDEGLPVDWIYLSVNRSFERLTGLVNIEGKRVLEAIPEIRRLTPELFSMYGRVAETGIPETFEIDFKPLHSWLKVSAFCPEKGYFVAVFEDITERRNSQDRIEELLRIQEEQLRIINTSPAVAFLWRAEEHWPVETVSDNITQFGYTPQDFLSGRVPFSSLVHPDELDRVGSEVEYNSSNHIDDFVQEYRIFGKNHDLFWIMDYTHIRRDPSGTITHYEGIVLDITERKRAEDALQESEHRSAMLLEAIPDMMFVISSDGVYRDFRVPDDSPLAIPSEQIIGTNVRDSGFGEEPTGTILYHLGMALDTNKLQLFEYELSLPQGVRQYEARLVALSTREVLGIVRDITERKQAEEDLKFSNVLLATQQDVSIDGILVVDGSGKIISFNKRFIELWGIPPDVIASGSDERALQSVIDKLSDPEEFTSRVNYLYANRDEKSREEVGLKDGRVFDRYSAPMIGSDGMYYGRVWYFRDITERKAAEEALRESRQLFADIISFLPDPTFVIDKDGIVIAWNRALEQLSGVPAAAVIGKGDHEYSLWIYEKRRPILIDLVLHPDRDAGRLNYVNIRQEGRTVSAQIAIRRQNSERLTTLSLVASPLFDSKGDITGAIESMRDITRLKEAEADLARINQNLEQMVRDRTRALEEEVAQRMRAEKDVQAALDYTRSVIEANPDLMVVLDSNGTIMDVNTAGEVLTGIKKDQLIGTPYFGYLVEDGTIQSAFAGLLQKGTIENQVRIQRTDGHITPLSVHATVIPGRDGSSDQIIVAAHDITRQKQDEDAIRASLDEKVVLLREIHHRVKNNLQIIISLTNLQMRQTNDPAIKQIISETQNRVRAMSLVHEKLYRSTSLSRIDFADYTRFLATQLFSYFGTDTRRVKLDFAMEEIMVDINTAVPLGLLMNELVSNALKHAFPDGKEGTIGIRGTTEGDRIVLVVRDDGIGMPPNLDWANTASLGMRLVTSLVDQVNGTITLDAGSGTAWTITVQKGQKSDREAGE
ncbi:MAG: hypothetical protein CVV32_10985 [Methanomicrobiales archaeon HGW-Methanomicrobiales-3]|jgi:PAS domain S-box-containing protein|nr:MAG: hypothetical protein CVV32_10985 [Methanomicrobiales archaeon HGW-Methanomicrobiales-3]